MDRKPLKIGELTARIPVIQGGMGVGISLSSLAGHVAKAGGIGIISTAQIGYRNPDFEKDPMKANLDAIVEELQKARAIAKDGIVGFNIMVATKNYREYVKTAVKAGADIIISGAGLPVDLPELVRGSKTKIAPIVSTVKSAKVIFKLWERKFQAVPDLVVIEGPKAGGHLGFTQEQLETFTEETYKEEIKEIISLTKSHGESHGKEIPVVVAGGIYDRKEMDEALALGADGVQMGTRFVTTYECDAAMEYKEAYLQAREEDIRIVKSPVGMPGRAIENSFIRETERNPGMRGKCFQCLEHCNPAKVPYCITKALIHAAKGELSKSLLFCGQNAYRSEKIEHVSDIMTELA